MTTLQDMVDVLQHCFDHQENAAIATVIKTVGSVYRRAGARSIVLHDGRVLGVVSGGCVEGDLFEHAKEVWSAGQGKQIEYDFRNSGDAIWGMGLGCNGAVTVWLQPFDPVADPQSAKSVIQEFTRREHATTDSCMGMVVESADEGVVPTGEIVSLSETSTYQSLAAVDISSVPERGTGLVRTTLNGVDVTLFVENLAARPRLLIYGAGEDARVLAKAAHFLDWQIEVVDHRPGFATMERFPGAKQVHAVKRTGYEDVPVDDRTFAVIMTHHYERDYGILKSLLGEQLPYIGLLGPQKRREKMLADLRGEGVQVNSAHLEKLFGPIGFDIGAETPEEIALSILAEALAVRNGRRGGSLRDRDEAIHEAGQHI